MIKIFPRNTDKDLHDLGWTLDVQFLSDVKAMAGSRISHISECGLEAALLAAEKIINKEGVI